MTPETAAQLLALNQTFYAQFATQFHTSRLDPADGFYALRDYLPAQPMRLLDVGCGNGRFGYFWQAHGRVQTYLGLDASPDYLAQAQQWPPHLTPADPNSCQFALADMSQQGFLAHLPPHSHDLVLCLAAMQHIPTHARRQALWQELATQVAPGGWLVLSNWQFLDSPRQQRKIVPWATIGIHENEVEAQDYLLRWSRGGDGVRYVALVDEATTAQFAPQANSRLQLVHQFRADGREGNLNLYTVWHNPADRVTVHKLDETGREVWQYHGRVLTESPHALILEAIFQNPDRDLGYTLFKQGDRFVEHFYNDRWYNIFAIYDRDDGQLKGWYCNLCRPTTWQLGERHIFCEDLALDLWVGADGTPLLLDEDEFTALGLGEEENTAVNHARQQLLDLAAQQQLPR
jgi:2-polyprenyl-3-methyl-5-hydroxy-6-metoxy-1,4-benzoquinol methylase